MDAERSQDREGDRKIEREWVSTCVCVFKSPGFGIYRHLGRQTDRLTDIQLDTHTV